MRGRSIGRLIDGALSGDPFSLLIVGAVVAGLLGYGIYVGRQRRAAREAAERRREKP